MYRYIIFISIAIMFIIFIFIGIRLTKGKAKEHFVQFNSANLNGKLENIRIAYKGVLFKLKEDKMEYIFYPNTDLTENKIFDHVAEKGDFVIKPAYSDTLKLVKKDKVLFYTFQKFNDEKDN